MLRQRFFCGCLRVYRSAAIRVFVSYPCCVRYPEALISGKIYISSPLSSCHTLFLKPRVYSTTKYFWACVNYRPCVPFSPLLCEIRPESSRMGANTIPLLSTRHTIYLRHRVQNKTKKSPETLKPFTLVGTYSNQVGELAIARSSTVLGNKKASSLVGVWAHTRGTTASTTVYQRPGSSLTA